MAAFPQNIVLATDARMLGARGGTGVARYARTLIDAQARLVADPVLVCDSTAFGQTVSLPDRVARWLGALAPWSRRAMARDGTRPGETVLHAPDLFRLAQVFFDVHRRLLPMRVPGTGVMHWSYPVPLRLVGWRNLYTVHDVIPLIRPDLTPIRPARYRRLLHAVARKADALVTVTEAARGEIVAALAISPERVVDCGQAIDLAGAPDGPLPPGLRAGGYFIVCGAVERRKNLLRLLRAYRASGVALPIAFAGPDGWGAQEVLAELAAIPRAIRLGYLPEADLRRVIASARALLMPSLAEGFGLPAAEAMALGTPVMASDTGALAEVTADAALHVDPLDEAGMREGLIRLASDDALCACLSRAGRQRALRYSPDRFAARLGALYAGLIARER